MLRENHIKLIIRFSKTVSLRLSGSNLFARVIARKFSGLLLSRCAITSIRLSSKLMKSPARQLMFTYILHHRLLLPFDQIIRKWVQLIYTYFFYKKRVYKKLLSKNPKKSILIFLRKNFSVYSRSESSSIHLNRCF